MIDHVDIRVSDLEASERFYDTLLPVIGKERLSAAGYVEWGDFAFHTATDDSPVTRRLHIGFHAATRELVDALPPRRRLPARPRRQRVEAVTTTQARKPGAIEYLGIRVADLAAAKRFYETVAPSAGIRLQDDTPERAHFVGENGSFSLIGGEKPTENLHMAFGASENASVDAFHRVAIEAGYRDNGAPGPRPIYHAGYYGAFVLDPDGNNIEAVNQNG